MDNTIALAYSGDFIGTVEILFVVTKWSFSVTHAHDGAGFKMLLWSYVCWSSSEDNLVLVHGAPARAAASCHLA